MKPWELFWLLKQKNVTLFRTPTVILLVLQSIEQGLFPLNQYANGTR